MAEPMTPPLPAPYDDGLDGSHDALNRMRRAHARGTGCHLTAEMIRSLSVTTIAEMWGAEDPREVLSPPPTEEERS